MEQINFYKSLQTPCFVLDVVELKRSIDGYQKALDSNFQKAIVGYSVKTNSGAPDKPCGGLCRC